MPVSREEIFKALEVQLSTMPVFPFVSRHLVSWTEQPLQPALFVRPYQEECLPPEAFGLNPIYIMTAQVWIYCQNGDPGAPSATNLTDLMDAVDAALAAHLLPEGRLTLGGLVFHCYREGKSEIADGAPHKQSVCYLFVKILVRDLIVPRTKILTVDGDPSSGVVTTGQTVALSLGLNAAVTVTGGPPTLALNSGGVAVYTGATPPATLAFEYTVGAGDTIDALAADALNLNGAMILDQYGKPLALCLPVDQLAGVLAVNPPV